MLPMPKPHMLRRRGDELMLILVTRLLAQIHEARDVEFGGFGVDGVGVDFVVGDHDAAACWEGRAVGEGEGLFDEAVH